ncbi:MAG: hypothetical protein U0800_07295 [Isosphaeraceae bacterium]
MELISGRISSAEILEELDVFIQILLDVKVPTVYVSFEFGCLVEGLVQAKDVPVATDDLACFLEDSEDRGVFELGESNVAIRSGIRGLYFLLCHEHDVHFAAEDDRLVRRVRNRWASLYRGSYAFHGDGRFVRLYGQVKRNPRE